MTFTLTLRAICATAWRTHHAHHCATVREAVSDNGVLGGVA